VGGVESKELTEKHSSMALKGSFPQGAGKLRAKKTGFKEGKKKKVETQS